MAIENCDYQKVLKDAQYLGFAESDPTNDVEGFDVLSKICILTRLGMVITFKIHLEYWWQN